MRRRRHPRNPAEKLALSGRFDRYAPEQEREVRRLDVKEDAVLRELKKAWQAHDIIKNRHRHRVLSYEDEYYGAVSESLKKLNYSATDVEKFSVALIEFEDEEHFGEKAGLFISALINGCKDEQYKIHTRHLKGWDINYLGYKNTKGIIVEGNVGAALGMYMEDGQITVNGDVLDAAGHTLRGGTITINGKGRGRLGTHMEGGSIVLNGNATACAGELMKGGSIIVRGNGGREVGKMMENGTITIEGDAGHSVGAYLEGGCITVKGDAGDYVGLYMSGGAIAVNGNAAGYVGKHMRQGTITIGGDAEQAVGWEMAGGVVRVKGNAGKDFGVFMSGGEIHLEGDYEDLADDIRGGKIYHKGKLIVDK